MALNPSTDTQDGSIVYTTSTHALDPVDMYRRLATEFGKDPFAIMLDAGPVLLANNINMMYRKADCTAVMHPGDIETVEAILYDRYLTASVTGK